MEIACSREGGIGVMGQQRRDLKRHPAVDAVGAGEDPLKQVGGPAQIRQRQVEEQVLSRFRVARLGISAS